MSDVVESNRPGSGAALRVAVIGLCCVLMSVASGILIINQKIIVFYVEDVGEQQSVRIFSRFSFFSPAIDVGSGPVTLAAFIFPRSSYEEQISTDWYEQPQQSQKQLTVSRYTTPEPLPQVAGWYTRKLGSDFAKTTGWRVAGQSDQDAWLSEVNKTDDSNAVLFTQSSIRRVRGVLLQAVTRSGDVRITLYDYQH